MVKLRIPQRYQAGVSKIRKIDDKGVRDVRAALDRTPVGVKPDEIVKAVAASVSGLNGHDLEQIGEALRALYGVRASKEISAEEFADDVCDAMEELESADRLQDTERSQFKEKLVILLGAESFATVSKASDLATDDERTFCGARILTDLRPVFGSDPESGPKGMVVVHLLKLSYHRGSERHQDFYVSLDADDLQTLRKTIDRAEAKARAIKSSIANIAFYGK